MRILKLACQRKHGFYFGFDACLKEFGGLMLGFDSYPSDLFVSLAWNWGIHQNIPERRMINFMGDPTHERLESRQITSQLTWLGLASKVVRHRHWERILRMAFWVSQHISWCSLLFWHHYYKKFSEKIPENANFNRMCCFVIQGKKIPQKGKDAGGPDSLYVFYMKPFSLSSPGSHLLQAVSHTCELYCGAHGDRDREPILGFVYPSHRQLVSSMAQSG